MLNKRLLIIGFTWPEPTTTAAGNRMLQLIHFFLEEGYHITFSSTATESERSFDLEGIGVQKVPIKLNHVSFDKFITSLNPGIVVFDRFLTEEQFGWRIAEFAPNAIRILDTEDLHSLRQSRENAFRSAMEFTTDLWLRNDITKREIASIYRSDISLVISSHEMRLLKDVLKIDARILQYLPFMIEPLSELDTDLLKPFADRKDFICIGNGRHAPNIDAIVWLKKEIWPLMRKQLPEANLNIYGAYLPEYVKQMHQPSEGFLVHGWIENVKEVMEHAKVNLAPLRFGAGLKGKLLEAMRCGTPSVTTAIGAEGMHDGSDFEFCGGIAETPNDIASMALALYRTESNWQTARSKGTAIVNSLFNKKEHGERLRTKIRSVHENLRGHRTSNFIGQLLAHHTMASTKYLSKWIAEKSKK